MKVMVTTVRGLEDVVAEELKNTIDLQKASYTRLSGKIFFELEGTLDKVITRCKKIIREVYTIERVILLVKELNIIEIKHIKEHLRNLLKTFLTVKNFSAVRAEELNCSLTSLEIANLVGQSLDLISLDDPDLIIRAICRDNIVYIGIDLTGFASLHRRFYRKYIHPSMLNPVIANAMLNLAGVKNGFTILDPMCGSGTILIECKLRFSNTKCLGFDINPSHLQGAYINSKLAGIRLELDVADVCSLKNKLEPETVDAVLTNPPYGIREKPIGGDLENIYRCLFDLSLFVLKRSKRICLITPRRALMRRILKEYSNSLKLIKNIKVIEGGLESYIYLLVKV